MNRANVLVIETQPLVPIGSLAAPLLDAGIGITYWRTEKEAPPKTVAGFSGLIALGGAPNPDQDDRYPWLAEERLLLAESLGRGVPTIGLCLGAELLAQILGAKVFRLSRPEIGWFDLKPEPEIESDPLCSGSRYRLPAFQWHSYGFSQPLGTARLAGTAQSTQAFRWGDCAWGFQFHLEANREIISSWVGHYRFARLVKAFATRTGGSLRGRS